MTQQRSQPQPHQVTLEELPSLVEIELLLRVCVCLLPGQSGTTTCSFKPKTSFFTFSRETGDEARGQVEPTVPRPRARPTSVSFSCAVFGFLRRSFPTPKKQKEDVGEFGGQIHRMYPNIAACCRVSVKLRFGNSSNCPKVAINCGEIILYIRLFTFNSKNSVQA